MKDLAYVAFWLAFGAIGVTLCFSSCAMLTERDRGKVELEKYKIQMAFYAQQREQDEIQIRARKQQ